MLLLFNCVLECPLFEKKLTKWKWYPYKNQILKRHFNLCADSNLDVLFVPRVTIFLSLNLLYTIYHCLQLLFFVALNNLNPKLFPQKNDNRAFFEMQPRPSQQNV